MHWTTDLWVCPNCGVEVGHTHRRGCAVTATTNAVVWQGPPVTPGMVPRLVVEGDVVAQHVPCLHCEEFTQPGAVVFENRQQSTLICGSCLLALAAMVPHEFPSPAEIEFEFERRRAEIFDRP